MPNGITFLRIADTASVASGLSLDLVNQGARFGVECENITTNYLRWTPGYSEEAYPHVYFGVGWRKDIPYLYGRVQNTIQVP